MAEGGSRPARQRSRGSRARGPASTRKTRIVILGGGVGAMSAAFELTDREGWQDEYEITVYQKGWRLGGKGASGRNQRAQSRIEEHGLHVWFGFYDNAFDLMQRCYRELRRPATAPLSTWDAAFTRHDFVVLEERFDGQWLHFPMPFPPNPLQPGRGHELLGIWDFVRGMLQWMDDAFASVTGRPPSRLAGDAADATGARAEIPWLAAAAGRIGVNVESHGLAAAGALVSAARRFADTLDHDPRRHRPWAHHTLLALFLRASTAVWRLLESVADRETDARRLWLGLDMGAAIIRGILADGLLVRGFDVIDDEDMVAWLRRHGAAESTLQSTWVRAGYDQAFAFAGGDIGKPRAAAGTALRATLRMLFNYKGAFMWKMTAGMGDVIFAPLYEVLRDRGVRFEFFHRVERLHVSRDRRSIAGITLGRQATLKPRYAKGGYDPLITVKGLPCWPSEPRYEQLVEGERLRAAHEQAGVPAALESTWSSWPDAETVSLRQGRDFDVVVLGIPPFGEVAPICKELGEANPRWKSLLTRVQTVRTQSFQLWLKPTLAELGWPLESPILSTYVEPLDTWADMTHLLHVEDWQGVNRPGTIAYFCGPMKDSPGPEPLARTNAAFPRVQHDQVKAAAIDYLNRAARYLWPNAATPNGFNWDLLVDPAGRHGPARFDAQYWIANIDPSERYVLSVPGSSTYRLPDASGDTGFDNLQLAGDWTRNGLNVGCVEAAVMSGMQASRAISGFPETVPGETDLPWETPTPKRASAAPPVVTTRAQRVSAPGRRPHRVRRTALRRA